MTTISSTTQNIGVVPALPVAEHDSTIQPRLLESFRLLALNVRRLLPEGGPRSILVMSAHDGDGRSFTAGSLARALFELAPPVLLVDADPLGAGLHAFLTPGTLRFAAPGKLGASNQAEFLMQTRLAIAEAEQAGFTVVIDTPACTRSSVAFSLASSVAGVLYLARRRAEDAAVHRDVRAQLDLLGAHVLGVVFNEA